MNLICNSKTKTNECVSCIHSKSHTETDKCHTKCPDDKNCKCVPEITLARKEKLDKINRTR